MLSNFAKLSECIVSNVLYSHVVIKFVHQKHGFIKGRSTVTNLCEFTHFVSSALDNPLQVDVIYTDSSKAFDQVDHFILLKELHRSGICDKLSKLLKSMIVNRVQCIEYGGFKPASFYVNSGEAQRSNLDPLLFNS